MAALDAKKAFDRVNHVKLLYMCVMLVYQHILLELLWIGILRFWQLWNGIIVTLHFALFSVV